MSKTVTTESHVRVFFECSYQSCGDKFETTVTLYQGDRGPDEGTVFDVISLSYHPRKRSFKLLEKRIVRMMMRSFRDLLIGSATAKMCPFEADRIVSSFVESVRIATANGLRDRMMAASFTTTLDAWL